MSNPPTANLHEIFSGIQGEGTLVGFRQIFLRFHGCHLACGYCDTPASRGETPAACAVEERAGGREIVCRPNPLSVEDVVTICAALQRDYPHHSVSLTGGEPLLHVPFLNQLIPALYIDAGCRSYLETNGALPRALAELVCMPDLLAMDIKLPSATGLEPLWEAHDAFLAIATRHYDDATPSSVQVKLVFGEDSLADITHAAALIAKHDPAIPCVLQPVTPHPGGPAAPSPATVLEAQRLAAQHLKQVRVIPQTHVLMGQW